MKNILILIILMFILGFPLFKVLAQDNTITIPVQNQTATPPDQNQSSESALLSTEQSAPTITSQKTVNSNVSCIKVGNPSEDLKAAVCKDNSTQVGIFGPVLGGPRPQAPDPGSDIKGAIQQQFGITMNGYDNQHLQWAWEKLWEVSNTNFDNLVRGAVINPTSVSNTQQVGCPPNVTVLLGPFPEETAFKHILTHELGHAIRNCAGRDQAQETAFLNAFHTEGGVSYYARNANACTGSDSPSEDYAEMIAFYLNPGTPVASYLKCYQQPQNAFTEQQFPLHYHVAQAVLGVF